MELDYAILADAAKVRENGLLHLVAGNIKQITAPHLPAPLNAALAVQFTGPAAEIGRPHVVEVRFIDQDGRPSPDLKPLRAEVNPPTPEGVDGSLLFVFELQQVALTSYGRFVIDVYLDGRSYKRLPLTITNGLAKAA
jgi:hypothetical protein